MTDDWQALEKNLHAQRREDLLAALARLREREAQLEKELGLEQSQAEIEERWASGLKRRAEAAEARVARLEEALREIADISAANPVEVARRALAQEEGA